VEIREALYAPHARIEPHQHERPMIAVPIAGTFEMELGPKRWTCRRGAAFTRTGQTHANRFGRAGARLVLIGLEDRELDAPALFEDPRAQVLAARLSEELKATDTAAPLAQQGLALEILALAMRAPKQPSLRRLDEFIDEHFLEPLRLEELALIAGLHPTHLARSFRKAHGESLAAHLRRRRIEWAMDRLRATDAPNVSIALEAGFCDQGHFSRVFRKLAGASPRAFRGNS
jgi:AraC family transcriptional regulator